MLSVRLIEWYQENVSAFRPPACKYHPSCSEYSKQAFIGYGAVFGSLLTAFRLLRCNPAADGGFDYLPEKISFLRMTLYKKECV